MSVLITHDGKVVTGFVRDSDDRWRETPQLSPEWRSYAASRPQFGADSARGMPDGVLDAAAHAPRYYGTPFIERCGQPPIALHLTAPLMGWWDEAPDASRGELFAMPADGDHAYGDGTVFRIRYQFPDGGAPIWHRHVASALDLLAPQADSVTVRMLRRVISQNNGR